jgi:hypothetical protein
MSMPTLDRLLRCCCCCWLAVTEERPTNAAAALCSSAVDGRDGTLGAADPTDVLDDGRERAAVMEVLDEGRGRGRGGEGATGAASGMEGCGLGEGDSGRGAVVGREGTAAAVDGREGSDGGLLTASTGDNAVGLGGFAFGLGGLVGLSGLAMGLRALGLRGIVVIVEMGAGLAAGRLPDLGLAELPCEGGGGGGAEVASGGGGSCG